MDSAHPKLRQFHAFWLAKTAGRLMPARPEFDVVELKPWLGNRILLEAIDGGADFRYRVYGTELVTYFGRDPTGERVSSLPPEDRAVAHGEYATVVESRRPLLVRHTRRLAGLGPSKPVPVDKLILPLSSDGSAVDMLLAGVYVHKLG